MKIFLFTLGLCGIFFMSNIQSSQAQSSQSKEQRKEQKKDRRAVKQAEQAEKNIASIERLNFSFYPNSVEPQFGLPIELDGAGDYFFTIDKDVMNMNLPYVGRFYVTPISPENKPINLTSTKFMYFVHTDNEITFEVTIIPSDLASILNQGIKFFFTINKQTQETTLKVSAENRQDVTYKGVFQ